MSETPTLLDLASRTLEKWSNMAEFTKLAYIRKMPNGKWKILSEKGKTLGIFPTKAKAVKRLRQIEYFKHHKGSDVHEEVIDLTHLKELSLSAILRDLRKQCDPETTNQFLSIYKHIFDALWMLGEDDISEKALPATLLVFSKLHSIQWYQDD